MKKFMKAIEDVLSFIGLNNSSNHWGTITWHEDDKQVWAPKYAPASEFGVENRSGSERRELIKKVPKKVKPKRKSVRRK